MSLSSNFPTVGPVLNLDFVNNQALDPRVAFTRASTATYFDYAGILRTAQNDTPRFDYNPSTLVPQGLLIEDSRTNSVRNNTMVGAAAGTPGTLPTNWFVYTPATGLTTSVVGTGTDNGISYIDVRVTGTASGGGNIIWGCDSNTGIAASNGQTWAQSTYLKIQGGTTTGIVDFRIQNDERSASAYIRTNASSALSLTTAALNTQRYSFAATLSGGGTVAYIVPYVLINFTVGVAIDITLRIGLPQLEQGAFATSVIPTSTVAVTRSADFASMTGTNFSSWYNAVEGVLYSQSQQYADRTSGFPIVTGVTDSTDGQNCIEHYWGNSTSTFGGLVYVSSAIQANLTTSGLTRTAVQKCAFAYKANDFASSLNGAAVSTDGSGTIPVVDRLIIGGRPTGGRYSGYIQRIAYYNYRVSNAQLQALTGS